MATAVAEDHRLANLEKARIQLARNKRRLENTDIPITEPPAKDRRIESSQQEMKRDILAETMETVAKSDVPPELQAIYWEKVALQYERDIQSQNRRIDGMADELNNVKKYYEAKPKAEDGPGISKIVVQTVVPMAIAASIAYCRSCYNTYKCTGSINGNNSKSPTPAANLFY